MTFQFTRYLYEKEEVELSFLICLFKKDKECYYWAYELYHSGFIEDLKNLFLKIYFLYFASLNLSFGVYLLNQLKEISKNKEVIGKIVANFLCRPFSLDVFLITAQVKYFDVEISNVNLSILNIESAHFFLEEALEADLATYLDSFMTCFDVDSSKILKHFIQMKKNCGSYCRQILLSCMFHVLSIKNNKKMGRNVNVEIDEEIDIEEFETVNEKRNYRVLEKGRKYEIDKNDYMNIFKLKRDEWDIKVGQFYCWEFYSKETPFWKEKMKNVVDFQVNHWRVETIIDDEDDFEEFYSKGYEPDEQKKEVQIKAIKELKKEKTWIDFVKEFNKNGVYEIEDEYLENFEKILF
jgi:hypothetical protein